MALSGRKTPQAARLYVKLTATQRLTAVRRRRAYIEVEQTEGKSQNEAADVES